MTLTCYGVDQDVSSVPEELPDVLGGAGEDLAGVGRLHGQHLDVQLVPGQRLQHQQLGALDVETEQVHPVQKDRDKGIS